MVIPMLRPIEEIIPCQCGNDDPNKFKKVPASKALKNQPRTQFRETAVPDPELPGDVWVCDECGEMPSPNDAPTFEEFQENIDQ